MNPEFREMWKRSNRSSIFCVRSNIMACSWIRNIEEYVYNTRDIVYYSVSQFVNLKYLYCTFVWDC
jgi:hypothetical protein